MIMPYGKYRGMPLDQVPSTALSYVCMNPKAQKELVDAARAEMAKRWDRKKVE